MMRFRRPAHSGARAGFTLLEMAVTVSMLGTFSMLIIETSESSSAVAEMANIEGQVFREGERAMSRILDDLRRSGSVTLGSKEYPHLFEEGYAGINFENYDHVPGVSTAAPSDSDYGTYRSIVLCLPSDLDGDGRPELDADGDGVPELDGNGDGVPSDEGSDVSGIWDPSAVTIHPTTRLSWSLQDVGYLVTATGPHGENELVRVEGGLAGNREVLATHVDRIQFDTAATASYSIPGGTVRVRLYFRVPASDGKVYRSHYEVLVRMKNG